MTPLRLLIFIGLSTTATFAMRFSPRKPFPITPIRKCEKCNLAWRCSPYYSDELSWALADGICEVFANGCMMGSYECARINECKSKLISTTQEECQQKCATGCENLPQNPHYGWVYELSPDGAPNDGYCKEFPNECAAKKWACEECKPLAGITAGNCP